ncbi:hypothetical protein ACP70R_042170 [Stipagrostis hirtigluma subsp. patula]
MATVPVPCSRWSAKQYIVAALLAVQVATIIAAVISISLAPARITFSITNATTSLIPVEGSGTLYNGFYNLTLLANNTSRRTSVKYDSLSAQIWYSETGWIPAGDVDTATALPGWQRPRSSTSVAVSADYGQYDKVVGNLTDSATSMSSEELVALGDSIDCRVQVQAKVWFRFGLPTWPYTVTATCSPVDFVSNTTDFPVVCGETASDG